MPKPHKIRLRGPWNVAFVELDSGSMQVVCTRKFNCPTGIEPSQAVHLQVILLGSVGETSLETAALNGQVLESAATLSDLTSNGLVYSVGDYLQPANSLELGLLVDPTVSPSNASKPLEFAELAEVQLIL